MHFSLSIALPLLCVALVAAAEPASTPENNSTSRKDWRELETVQDVYDAYPDRVEKLFLDLDLDRPELAAVRSAVERKDYVTACNRLLEHYRTADTAAALRNPEPIADDETAAAELILVDKITLQNDLDTVPRIATGGLDWLHRGPSKDVEWAFSLNRHKHLLTLFRAYLKSHDKRFVRRLDNDLRDWINASLPYPAKQTRSPLWRGLETNFRVSIWSQIFFALQNDPELRPATRLMMLSSLPEHGHYLRNFHRDGGNWLAMESAALGELAVYWPEFKSSRDWIEHAQQMQERQITRQVYPDGVQDELSSLYHAVALANFERFAETCRRGKVPVSSTFRDYLENMNHYLARVVRPDGTNPLNGDSDVWPFEQRIRAAAAQYGRDDWIYIASAGQQGKKPAGPPSTMFPWAGQLISRSGWDRDAQWSFFDVGPWGTGHQHSDKLHLSIFAEGRDLLVDSGRFAYDGTLADQFKSSYARHSRGHNVILIDGNGQAPGPRRVSEPLPEHAYRVSDEFDFARGDCGHFDDVDGEVQHTRAVFYVRGDYWIVLDRITSDRPRKIEALWHFHPDSTPERDGVGAVTTDKGVGNLRIVPIGSGPVWELELVRSQISPYPQGWYSDTYGKHRGSTCAVYTAEIDGPATFGWVITAAKGEPTRLQTTLDSVGSFPVVSVVESNGTKTQLRIPLVEGEPSLMREVAKE